VSDVRVYLYNDNGGVKPAVSYQLQYLTAAGEWLDISNQVREPIAPAGNDLIGSHSIQSRLAHYGLW
jgi:hypothetical protein